MNVLNKLDIPGWLVAVLAVVAVVAGLWVLGALLSLAIKALMTVVLLGLVAGAGYLVYTKVIK